MMLGVEPFFRAFESPLTVEALLKDEAPALLGVLQVIRRAQRASHYAYEWARERLDLTQRVEEVTLAALLHDSRDPAMVLRAARGQPRYASCSRPTVACTAPTRNGRSSDSPWPTCKKRCVPAGTCRNCSAC